MMKEGKCHIHGSYYTDPFTRCPTCYDSRPSAFCWECGCITNHTTKEHQEAEALGDKDEGGEA